MSLLCCICLGLVLAACFSYVLAGNVARRFCSCVYAMLPPLLLLLLDVAVVLVTAVANWLLLLLLLLLLVPLVPLLPLLVVLFLLPDHMLCTSLSVDSRPAAARSLFPSLFFVCAPNLENFLNIRLTATFDLN